MHDKRLNESGKQFSDFTDPEVAEIHRELSKSSTNPLIKTLFGLFALFGRNNAPLSDWESGAGLRRVPGP